VAAPVVRDSTETVVGHQFHLDIQASVLSGQPWLKITGPVPQSL